MLKKLSKEIQIALVGALVALLVGAFFTSAKWAYSSYWEYQNFKSEIVSLDGSNEDFTIDIMNIITDSQKRRKSLNLTFDINKKNNKEVYSLLMVSMQDASNLQNEALLQLEKQPPDGYIFSNRINPKIKNLLKQENFLFQNTVKHARLVRDESFED